jgi:hypothetical protein
MAGCSKLAFPQPLSQPNNLLFPLNLSEPKQSTRFMQRECQPPSESLIAKKLSVTQTTPAGEPPAEEKKGDRTFSVSLMDICRLDTPLVKRIPNSQRSAFATSWGRLLDEAIFSGQLGSWADFFMFPKCILWTPVRGGKRLSRKCNMADLVRSRLTKWKTDPGALWKDVIERSKKPLVSVEQRKTKGDGARLEEAVIGALRLGDVRKALQMLNSAPIAPKTPAIGVPQKAPPHG